MAEIWGIGFKAEEEAVIGESGRGVDMDQVQVRPEVPGTVGMARIMTLIGTSGIIPVCEAIPGSEGILGQGLGYGFSNQLFFGT